MLFQAFDDEHTRSGCVFNTESDQGLAGHPPPGPADIKHFDILEFVTSQEVEPQHLGAHDIHNSDSDNPDETTGSQP